MLVDFFISLARVKPFLFKISFNKRLTPGKPLGAPVCSIFENLKTVCLSLKKFGGRYTSMLYMSNMDVLTNFVKKYVLFWATIKDNFG
jgi:hypothetical protein